MTSVQPVRVAKLTIGPGAPLAIISGPCVAESLELCLQIAGHMQEACAAAGLSYIFKASFDKANRSSIESYRGPGLDRGLAWLAEVRQRLNVPVTTDVHEPGQCEAVGRVVDLIQVPAFLCRQTDLLAAAAATGKPVNVKKGQFMAPWEMKNVAAKLVEGFDRVQATPGVILTERGTFFGYNRLVNDFAGVADMMELGWPVCFDVTHSTQLPGGGEGGKVTGGRPQRAPLLARCAVVSGVHALFLEAHPEPAKAKSDAATSLTLQAAATVVREAATLRAAMTA